MGSLTVCPYTDGDIRGASWLPHTWKRRKMRASSYTMLRQSTSLQNAVTDRHAFSILEPVVSLSYGSGSRPTWVRSTERAIRSVGDSNHQEANDRCHYTAVEGESSRSDYTSCRSIVTMATNSKCLYRLKL